MPSQFESEEYINNLELNRKTYDKTVNVVPCFAFWSDICGFGSKLEENSWNLENMNKSGVLSLLSTMYTIFSNARLPGVDPFPYDVTLILNDGLAKNVDTENIENVTAILFIFFLRDLLFGHYWMLENTKRYNISIRSVISIGERTNYSVSLLTGKSILSYNEKKISDFGKKILQTTYVYNPEKFQMNTAFAKAFSVEALGHKGGIEIGGFYIDINFYDVAKQINGLNIKRIDNEYQFYINDTKVISLGCQDDLNVSCKGQNISLNRIVYMEIFKELDGDDVFVDLMKK